jgi:hypothetical protein
VIDCLREQVRILIGIRNGAKDEKGLYSMAGRILMMEFFNWTKPEARVFFGKPE